MNRRIPKAFVFLLSPILAGAANAPLPDSVTPCVPCHNRQESNQVAEWLASPYSESEGGRGCSGCHASKCSGQASPQITAKEAASAETPLPVEAARVTVRATCWDGAVKAEVAVSNVGVGHLLPSGSRERTLFLEVTAQDKDRVPLPEWNPGESRDTSEAVAGSMVWLSAEHALPGSSVTVQRRLLPFATDVSRHQFVAPESGPVRVSARLVLIPASGPYSEIANTSTVCQPSGEVP